LWSGCGGLTDGDRAIVPFGVTCYEKLTQQQDASNNRIIPSTLSIVTGVKYAPENEFTQGEINADVLPVDPFNLGGGNPRTYLYYSRRATTSYLPCDNTNFGDFLGTYKCSCEWLPCMDEIMLAAVPVKYGSTPLVRCQDLNPINEAFPSIFEVHLEGITDLSRTGPTATTSLNSLYPLIGPNMYDNGILRNTFRVGLNWDSNANTELGITNPNDPNDVAGANAYKLQSNYYNTYYVDYIEPTYFWNRPITFLNIPAIMKSHSPVTSHQGTYFRLQRLHDLYHINCSSTIINGQTVWGEYGYVPGNTNTMFPSFTSILQELPGPVVPKQVGQNDKDAGRT
jgi:hypothetical protein